MKKLIMTAVVTGSAFFCDCAEAMMPGILLLPKNSTKAEPIPRPLEPALPLPGPSKEVRSAAWAAGMEHDEDGWVDESVTLPLDDDILDEFYGERYAILGEYENHGVGSWRTDGERFITQPFIDECVQTRGIPLLNDDRPELPLWLEYTFCDNLFLTAWNTSERLLAGDFAQHMRDTYDKRNITDLSSEMRRIFDLSRWSPVD